jgi:DNA-binding transcriptional ArsR family regulator
MTTTERTLPADINAERAVLGSCLLERDAILEVQHLVSQNDFYLEKHAWVYDAIITCLVNKVPPDLVTVADELRRRNRLESIGGVVFLTELTDEVPTAVHAEYYAQIVARCSRQRDLAELSGHILAAAYDEGRDPQDIYQEIEQRLQIEQRAAASRPEWATCTIRADRLYTKHFEPKPPIIEDILPQGTFLLTGKPKTKKSWLVLNYALAVAWGGKALGHFQAVKGDVLYIDLEMGQRRMHERLHVASPNVVVPNNLYFADEWPRVYGGCDRWLREWMDTHPLTRLVIFDTQVGIRPSRERNEEPYEHEKAYMQHLTTLCHDYNLAILFVHHSRKVAGADVIDDASGSTGLTAGVDNYGSLSRSANERNAGVLRLLGRDIRLDDDLNLSWDTSIATWCYKPDAPDYSLTPERREVLSLLREQPGLYPRQIQERMNKAGNTVRKLLMEMKRAGLVVSEDGRYYSNEPFTPETA